MKLQCVKSTIFNAFSLSAEVDECAENTDSCDINADCFNTPGSFCCVCMDGYYGNGFNCTGKILPLYSVNHSVIVVDDDDDAVFCYVLAP